MEFCSRNFRKEKLVPIALEATLGSVLSSNIGVSTYKNEHVSKHIVKLGSMKVETFLDSYSERDQILLKEVKTSR